MNNNANKHLTPIDREAEALLRSARGQETPSLYVEGSTCPMTKERAYAQSLENNPEAYANYRRAHSAAPMIAQLQNAGFLQR